MCGLFVADCARASERRADREQQEAGRTHRADLAGERGGAALALLKVGAGAVDAGGVRVLVELGADAEELLVGGELVPALGVRARRARAEGDVVVVAAAALGALRRGGEGRGGAGGGGGGGGGGMVGGGRGRAEGGCAHAGGDVVGPGLEVALAARGGLL